MTSGAGEAQRWFGENVAPAVVVVNKTLQRGIVDDEIVLGVTASRLVMHFCFDQYYYQRVKMDPSAAWIAVTNLAPDLVPRGVAGPGRDASPFVFLWLVLRSLCAVVLLLVFGGGMSLLNQVMWAGACVHLTEQTNLHLMGRRRPN